MIHLFKVNHIVIVFVQILTYYYSLSATLRPHYSITTKSQNFKFGMVTALYGAFLYFDFQSTCPQGPVSAPPGAKINVVTVPTELLFRSAWNLVGILFRSWQSADTTFGLILTLTFVIKTWVNIEQNVSKCIT